MNKVTRGTTESDKKEDVLNNSLVSLWDVYKDFFSTEKGFRRMCFLVIFGKKS